MTTICLPAAPHQQFSKIARPNRAIVVTEKIDGTNGLVYVTDEGFVCAGSRTRWIESGNDNFGFASWVEAHASELQALGPGFHYGEWWGHGIQRGYGLPPGDRRFSLFNTSRWAEERPACCGVVPTLYSGPFSEDAIKSALADLRVGGSRIAPFMNPEGVVVYHTAGNVLFKATITNDAAGKGENV